MWSRMRVFGAGPRPLWCRCICSSWRLITQAGTPASRYRLAVSAGSPPLAAAPAASSTRQALSR
eukprot:4063572-Prymnesium_polylepis.1